MSKPRIRRRSKLAAACCLAVALAGYPAAHAAGALGHDEPTGPVTRNSMTQNSMTRNKATGALMSVASPADQFPRNAQRQPVLAVDPAHPQVVVAAGNDLVDLPRCSKEAATTGAACGLPANPAGGGRLALGVGLSGVYFSFDSGRRWTQPTYQGLTAAGCDPTVEPCTPKPGPIHTVPNYYEKGLAARGGAAAAIGPVLRDGKFSWANGSRAYVSSAGSTLTNTPIEPGRIDSRAAVMVSHLDDPTPARVADQSNWSAPVIVPERTPAVSSPTGLQIWADNAASSRYFGRVYMCYNDFQITGNDGPIQPTVAASGDGGQTWATRAAAPPTNSAAEGYRMSCTIRTDSRGAVYAFFTHFSGHFPSHDPAAALSVVKSSDGGATWTAPVDFMQINNGCFYVDRIGDRCTEEGPAGTANEPGPSVSVANGAPTGHDATDEMMLTWADGRFGQNREAALLSYSKDRAKTWSEPAKASLPGERVLYAATAIAPDASRVYLTYNAFTTPFSPTTADPRLMRGALRSAAIGRHGEPAGWSTEYTGRTGDARGTTFTSWNYPEFLGFFVSAAATRRYGIGAWTDVSRTADCPVIDRWRQATLDAGKVQVPAPWPQTDCPANFGNADGASATTAR
ncbi:hypothetical protein ACGFNU_15210 [Spirillospora sp. NPDC048911]|uniref:hypothetical protein n=1 Tax=Spirillospora sp. NPDC048911 TaxID=3364527 RepID=UPI00371BA876